MIKAGKYYKHKDDKDIVLRIHDVMRVDENLEITASWHRILPNGTIERVSQSIGLYQISLDEVKEWSDYDSFSH